MYGLILLQPCSLLNSVIWAVYYSKILYFLLQVDPNTGVAMYESDDIVKYLVDKYGEYAYLSFVSSSSWQILPSTSTST